MHGNTRRDIISTVRVAAGAISRDFRFISCFAYSPKLLESGKFAPADRNLATAQHDDKRRKQQSERPIFLSWFSSVRRWTFGVECSMFAFLTA